MGCITSPRSFLTFSSPRARCACSHTHWQATLIKSELVPFIALLLPCHGVASYVVPLSLVSWTQMIAEITDKGKIADLYNYKTQIESYKGADDEIMICKDEKEVYGDDGFVMCVDEADKLHFIAHIAAGNGLPPKL